MKFGGINYGGRLGGWHLINKSCDMMPQDLASVDFTSFGAKYEPVWLVAEQIVNGKNYMTICKITRSDEKQTVLYAGVIINIPAGSVGGKGATIVQVIEDIDLVEGVPVDLVDQLKGYFKTATKKLQGVGFTPILYLGQKVVKGINYYVFAEAKIMYPNSEPYGVLLEINVINNDATVTAIERFD